MQVEGNNHVFVFISAPYFESIIFRIHRRVTVRIDLFHIHPQAFVRINRFRIHQQVVRFVSVIQCQIRIHRRGTWSNPLENLGSYPSVVLTSYPSQIRLFVSIKWRQLPSMRTMLPPPSIRSGYAANWYEVHVIYGFELCNGY